MSSYGGVELGVQIIGSEIGVKNAFGEAIASADAWATETEAAGVKAARSLELTGLSAKQAAVAYAKLGLAAEAASTAAGDSTLAMQAAAVRFETTMRGLYARQQADAVAATAAQERAAMKYETALMGAGRTMTTYLTIPMALLGYESMKLSTNFQAAMLRIQTYAGATGAEVKRQSANILNNAGVLPQGPIQSAESLYHLESIGIRGPRAFEALKTAALAAGAGMADLTSATTALGGALVAGIKGTQNLHEAMGGLVTIAGEGNMTMQDLVDAMGTGLLVKAHNVGISLREVGAALAVLVDRGIPARRAATYLGTTFALMSAPSKAAKNALADMGVNADQMGKMLLQPNGLIDVLNMLHAGMERVGKARGAADLMAAFGRSRQSTGIQTLVQSLDAPVSNYSQKLQQYDKGVGEAARRMALYQKSAQYEFHTAVSQIEADMIRVGTSALPYVAHGVKDLAGGIDALVKGFDSLPGPIRSAFGVMAGGVAAVGPLLLILGLAMKGYRQLMTSMGRLAGTAQTSSAEVDTALTGVGTSAEVAAAKVMDLKAALADIPVSGVIGQTESGLLVVGKTPAGLTSQLSQEDAAKLGFQTGEQSLANAGMMAGLRSGIGTAMSRLIPGLMFAMGGQLVGGMLQTQFHGQVGNALSNVAQGAGLGAGVGMFFPEFGGPVTGAAVGAGIGALYDGLKAITNEGPSFTDQMSRMRASVDAFGTAMQRAKQDMTGLKSNLAALQLNKDQLLLQIRADRSAVRANPGSKIAQDQLAADVAQLREINTQLDQYNNQLNKAKAHEAALAKARQQHITEIAKNLNTMLMGPVWHDAINGSTGTDAHYMQLFAKNLQDAGKAAAGSDPEMAAIYRRIAQISSAMKGMITFKKIRIAIEEVISQENVGPTGARGPVGAPGPYTTPKAIDVVPLTAAQQIALAFAANKYNRANIEREIAIDNAKIARLKAQRESGKIDNLQYVNAMTSVLQDRQTMESNLKTLNSKRTSSSVSSNDLLLARARNDLQQGMWQEAQTLLKRDLARLEGLKAEAKTSADRNAIEKQILEVKRVMNSKAAGYQTSLALQLAQAKADALAAADPGLSGPTAQQLKIAREVKAAAVKAINAHHLTMQGMIDAWNVVAQANAVIAQAFVGSSRTYYKTSTDAIADSIKGLTTAQEMQLRERLAQRDAHRGFRPAGAGADGFVIPEGNTPHHRRRRRAQSDAAGAAGSSSAYAQRNAVGGINIASARIEINGVEDPRKILEEVEKLIRRRGGQRTGTRR